MDSSEMPLTELSARRADRPELLSFDLNWVTNKCHLIEKTLPDGAPSRVGIELETPSQNYQPFRTL